MSALDKTVQKAPAEKMEKKKSNGLRDLKKSSDKTASDKKISDRQIRGNAKSKASSRDKAKSDTSHVQAHVKEESQVERRLGRQIKVSKAQDRQAKQIKKREEQKKKDVIKNERKKSRGEKYKDVDAHVPTIWEKIAEPRLYSQLREVGDSIPNIDKFQRKRVIASLFLGLLVCVAAFFLHPWLFILAPIAMFAFYKMRIKSVDNFYKNWKFQRHLNFSKFTRLVIPYLKASGGSVSLYTVFTKILNRTEDPADRNSLYQLMGEMGDNPSSIKPFTDYADRSSGTDMSHLFMTTIYDFQQSTFDTTVIDELGKMASEDMMLAIDEIIAFKLKRFAMFPTKVTMSSFILVLGIGAGLLLHNFQGFNFNDSMVLDPADAAETQDVDPDPTSGGEAASTDDIEDADEEQVSEDEDASENDSFLNLESDDGMTETDEEMETIDAEMNE